MLGCVGVYECRGGGCAIVNIPSNEDYMWTHTIQEKMHLQLRMSSEVDPK